MVTRNSRQLRVLAQQNLESGIVSTKRNDHALATQYYAIAEEALAAARSLDEGMDIKVVQFMYPGVFE